MRDSTHHEEPRLKLCVQDDETVSNSLKKYVDVMRQTPTNMGPKRTMSVFLRMDGDHEIPDLTYKTSSQDKVGTRKIEETTRPDSMWLEAWMHLSKTQKRRGIPDWEEEHACLQAARCNRESMRLRQKIVSVDHLHQSNQKKNGNSFMRRQILKSADLVCFSRRVIRSKTQSLPPGDSSAFLRRAHSSQFLRCARNNLQFTRASMFGLRGWRHPVILLGAAPSVSDATSANIPNPTRWVFTNKGDTERPFILTRLVARDEEDLTDKSMTFAATR